MGLFQAISEVEFPESDGRPMGETDVHRQWMIRIYDLLARRYRRQRVYVSCDLLVYYTEGMPHDYVVPDVFVVKDSDPRQRRIYKIWEEGAPPHVVFEVTSKGTRREDEVHKPGVYAKMGVRELFLYDPTQEYLEPPLQGFLLGGSAPTRIEPDVDGKIASADLGLTLRLDGVKLVLTDAATGEVLLTDAEAERAARLALEAELKRLREQLDQKDGNGQ